MSIPYLLKKETKKEKRFQIESCEFTLDYPQGRHLRRVFRLS